MSRQQDSRIAPEARLSALRDEWIAAENRRTSTYHAFMEANRMSPLRKELDQADKIEKRAQEAYRAALTQQERNESAIYSRTAHEASRD